MADARQRYDNQLAQKLFKDGVLYERDRGSTFNDGGSWHTWIYASGKNDGRYFRIHQATDYRADYSVTEVKPVTVSYRSWQRV